MIIRTLKLSNDKEYLVGIFAFFSSNPPPPQDIIDLISGLSKNNFIIQILDANKIATWEHLFFSVYHAYRAFAVGRNISRTLSTEIAIFASLQRQISVAFKKVGIQKKTRNFACIIATEKTDLNDTLKSLVSLKEKILSSTNGIENDALLEVTTEKEKLLKSTFSITNDEISVVEKMSKSVNEIYSKIILNKMALLELEL